MRLYLSSYRVGGRRESGAAPCAYGGGTFVLRQATSLSRKLGLQAVR